MDNGNYIQKASMTILRQIGEAFALLATLCASVLAVLPAVAATGGDDAPAVTRKGSAVDPDQAHAPVARPTAYGNPLWAIPLATLSISRQRPPFTPSRRPPAPPPPVVVAPPQQRVSPPKAPEPERLQLALIGTVVGSAESIGVFLDQPTQRLIRLKIGEEHAGWILRAVRPREVTLEKGARVEILSLPQPGAAPVRANQAL